MCVDSRYRVGDTTCTCGPWASILPPPPCPVHHAHSCCSGCIQPHYLVITSTTTNPGPVFI